MPKKLSKIAKKEAISRETIKIFCHQTGRRWGVYSLADSELLRVLTLIESYFEAREKVGRGKMAKEN